MVATAPLTAGFCCLMADTHAHKNIAAFVHHAHGG